MIIDFERMKKESILIDLLTKYLKLLNKAHKSSGYALSSAKLKKLDSVSFRSEARNLSTIENMGVTYFSIRSK